MMKKFLYALAGLYFLNGAYALDYQCGKMVELVPVPSNETLQRPLLVVKTGQRSDGTVYKRYKPLTAANEAVADFLTAVDRNIKVCIKYYDPVLPAPVPLHVLGIYLDD